MGIGSFVFQQCSAPTLLSEGVTVQSNADDLIY